MPKSYEITPLTRAHANQWLEMRRAAVRDFPRAFLPTVEETQKLTLAEVEARLENGIALGAFIDDQLVGVAHMHASKLTRLMHFAEIGPIYVDPKFHRQGIARDMIDELCIHARNDGRERVQLYVDTENHTAIKFYEDYGFERVATIPDGVRINGMSRDDHLYYFWLNPV